MTKYKAYKSHPKNTVTESHTKFMMAVTISRDHPKKAQQNGKNPHPRKQRLINEIEIHPGMRSHKSCDSCPAEMSHTHVTHVSAEISHTHVTHVSAEMSHTHVTHVSAEDESHKTLGAKAEGIYKERISPELEEIFYL